PWARQPGRAGRDAGPGGAGQRLAPGALRGCRARRHRRQAGVRLDGGRPAGAGGRDQPRHLPLVGPRDRGPTGQGPLPPGPGRGGGGLPGGQEALGSVCRRDPRREGAELMPRFRAVVDVMLRKAILDPQGRAVEATLHRLGHGNVSDLRIGKRIELTLEGERDAVETQLAEMAAKVLSNPVMEDLSFELVEVTEDATEAAV